MLLVLFRITGWFHGSRAVAVESMDHSIIVSGFLNSRQVVDSLQMRLLVILQLSMCVPLTSSTRSVRRKSEGSLISQVRSTAQEKGCKPVLLHKSAPGW